VSVEKRLSQGLEQLAVSNPEEIKQKLIAFIALLNKWNRVYNLTAIRDPEKMVTHHVLDSLAVAPFIQGADVLDVGSGAGLPGVPLAIVSPARQFVLIDSNAKKTRFIQQAKVELGLNNVVVETTRAERYHPTHLFDTVISRAFSSISQFILTAAALCKPGGVIIAMKGEYPTAELQDIPNGYSIKAILAVEVPLLVAQRHIVCISPSGKVC
jgi:16S rRNA (guanine527-N7)-methyltransferase